jgi:hypothetical protein
MSKEFGIKPYIKEDDPHVKRMRRPTWSHQMTIQEEKHSELVKPYEWDDYQEQEHFYPNPIFNPEWPHDMPDEELIVDRTGTDLLPCLITCIGNGGARAKCSRPIRCRFLRVSGQPDRAEPDRVTLLDKNDDPVDSKVTFPTLDTFEVHPEDSWDDYFTSSTLLYENLRVRYEDPQGSVCTSAVQVFCSCACPAAVTFEEDTGSTPDTIAPGATVSIYVQGGCGPYDWSTSSSGYTLGSAQTSGLSNTLTSASGTCNTNFDPNVKVTVTDKCGTSVDIFLRNTDGSWQNQSSSDNSAQCTASGFCNCSSGPHSATTVFHEGEGAGGVYVARFVGTYYTSCVPGVGGCPDQSPCDTSRSLGSSSCSPGDDILRSELGISCSDCWGNVTMAFWTCGECT